MRLSCPNCGAQYEVPAEVIPENGRDVQCSNCGHTWFQVHPDHDPEMSADLGTSAPDEGWSPDAPAATASPQTDQPTEPSAPAIETEEVQPPEMAFDDSDETDTDATPETAPDSIESAVHSMVSETGGSVSNAPDKAPDAEDALEPAPREQHEPKLSRDEEARFPVSPSPRPRRKIDQQVIDVLREEAEHEARLRSHENDSDLETQPDLGLESSVSAPVTDPRADQARARMQGLGDMAGDDDTNDLAEDPHAARRDLLPDIEEINSTLRSADDRSPEEAPVIVQGARRRRRIGFRLGFGFTMLAASFVILAYVYNKEIIAAWPAGEAYVTSFVDMMNSARIWLDDKVTTAMLWLDQKASAAGGNVDGNLNQ